MSGPKRDLPVSFSDAAKATLTRPVYLVKIAFTTTPYYVSTRGEHEYAGNTYLAHSADLRDLRYSSTGQQNGTLVLYNENYSASAVVLTNKILDVPITIYKAYVKDDGSLTDVVVEFQGVADAASINRAQVELTLKEFGSREEMAPNKPYSSANGFNHLLAEGTIIEINGERYRLGGN